nr:unnamed protein product [Callosobruchus analis]
MDSSKGILCSRFVFYNKFDSANLAKVEYIPQDSNTTDETSKSMIPDTYDAEFNVWTKPDCAGTPYENGNRTWFYFGFRAPEAYMYVRLNLVNLNKQGKMYNQGMTPVYRVLPGKPRWDRIQDKPVCTFNEDVFTLSFTFRTPENTDSIAYFAFTYPFTYLELEKMMVDLDNRYLYIKPICEDDIYYVRETVVHSVEARNVDLITISSYQGITAEREPQLKNIFIGDAPRPFKFVGKKVIFVSARVHPGETPSSFVFNGLLNLLLNRDDLRARSLRRLYVFKMIPCLNPDGVAMGHFRTDSRGVNLNRVYLNPSLTEHPSIYAARALIRYYHFGVEKEDIIPKCDDCKKLSGNETDRSYTDYAGPSQMSSDELDAPSKPWCTRWHNFCRICGNPLKHTDSREEVTFENVVVGGHGDVNSSKSGLFMYLDLHGHATKKGVFMYGNHFDDVERNVECMLLPKLMSINNHNFHFNACNFTERNMYLEDKRDGMSRAGSGRVAVLSTTGIIKSYTLECNYNTGRIVNVLPPTVKEHCGRVHSMNVPPKYTPHVFEEVGRSIGASILDLTGHNPFSRLPNSEFHTLNGLRDWLRSLQTSTGPIKRKDYPKGARFRPSTASTSTALQVRPSRTKTQSRASVPRLVTSKRHQKAPLDRKKSITNQPLSKGSRAAPRESHKCVKVKSRKDLTLKIRNIEKSTAIPKKKTASSVNLISGPARRNFNPVHKNPGSSSKIKMSTLKPNKAQTTDEEDDVTDDASTTTDNVHLREIRFYKNQEGCKTVVATYENANFDNDSLVVSWNATSRERPRIYTHKTRVLSAPPFGSKAMSEMIAAEAKRGGGVRVHNFNKRAGYNVFNRPRRNALRRLASSADIEGKLDKRKKKVRKGK